MPVFDNVIAEALTPVFALSGIGVFANGLTMRLNAVSGRAREMHLRIVKTTNAAEKQICLTQSELFIKRSGLIRQAIFALYTAIGCVVFTAIATALKEIFHNPWETYISVFSFLLGLILTFLAVVIESLELMLSMRTLEIDQQIIFLPHIDPDAAVEKE